MNNEMTNEEYQGFLNTIDTLPKDKYEIIKRGVLQLNEDKKQLYALMRMYEERISSAIETAYEYGQEDGSHHKAWVIDQMIRELLANDYKAFVKEYEMPDEEGDYCEWDIGIAP